MEIGIKELAGQLKLDQQNLIELAQRIGIENNLINESNIVMLFAYIINDKQNFYNDELKNKERELKKFHEKLKQGKDEFESYKKSEKTKLKEKLLQDAINHKKKLEEEKIQEITKLNNEFLENIKNEYDNVNSKLDEFTQKELKLNELQQTLDQEQKKFSKEKELFESQKKKLLDEYKQELEKDKEIFNNKLEEERVKKLEEINTTIEKLYKKKEESLESKEEELREERAKLKTSIAEVEAKEKFLEQQEQSLSKQVQEKIALEIKNYQEKIKAFEKQNQALLEELSDLREELDSCERFENRDLPRELDQKQQDIIRLKKLLEEETDMKNELQLNIDNISNEYSKEKVQLTSQIDILRRNIKETDALKSENILLTDKVFSLQNHIEFLKGENKELDDRLKSIYSDGTEIEERIKDIKEKPYKKITLENQINTNDEIKYLDAMQENMKKYGVEYPKRLLYAFHTALKSADFSPLTVLSGVSGTGKSELPKLYSHFGGFNFLAEAVQPTWDSPASMIGYYNTIDRKFDSTNILKFLLQTSQSKNEAPFGLKESMNMVLLDEMNLAHIELYFAEFLSKFELRRGSNGVNLDIQLGTALNYQLPLDRNVLWIGTMNEDETTKALSDKVLDRSFSINFPRPTELKSRSRLQTLNEIKKFEYLHRNTWDTWIQKESLFTGDKNKVLEKYKEMSNQINHHLAPTGRAIGHRVWQSMEYYMNNHPLVIQNKNNEDELEKNVKLAFEEQLVQKIMPKLRGIEVHGKEKEALMGIKDILNQNDFKMTEDFELSMDNPYRQFIWNSANYLKED